MDYKVKEKPNQRYATETSGLIRRFSTQSIILKSLTGREVQIPQNLIITEPISRGFNWGYGGLFFYGKLPEDVLGKDFELREVYSSRNPGERIPFFRDYECSPNQKPIQVYNKKLKSERDFMTDEPTGELLIPDAQCLSVNYGDKKRKFFFSRRTGKTWEVL